MKMLYRREIHKGVFQQYLLNILVVECLKYTFEVFSKIWYNILVLVLFHLKFSH